MNRMVFMRQFEIIKNLNYITMIFYTTKRLKFLKYLCLSVLLSICLFSGETFAWEGMPTPQLHIEGNKLKDPTGKEVLLHGWMQPTASWFSGGGRWYNDPSNWKDTNNVAGFLNFMNEIADLMSDTSPRYGQNHGWYTNFVRMNTDAIGGWTQQAGLLDTSQFDAWINNFIIPYAKHLESRGLYLVLSATGPINTPDNGTHNAGVTEQQRLRTFWSRLANTPGVKSANNIMFELMNEPVDIESSPGNGDWGNHQNKYFEAFTNWVQPIIDDIRNTGAENIIWVPTLEWQGSPYQWDLYPFTGTNIGVACHYYPAYGGVFDNPTAVQDLWDRQYKPAADRWPMIITELFWTPYPDDPWNLVNGSSEGFGNAIKKAMDNQGNVSYIVGFLSDLLDNLNDSRPADCDLSPREGARSFFNWQPTYIEHGPDDGTPKLEIATVTNGNPKQINIFFNHPIENADSIEGFTVKVDSQIVEIDSVVLGDSTNQLTIFLQDSILIENQILLSYNNGNVLSVYDKNLGVIENKLVENLLDGAPPRIISITTNINGDSILIKFNKKMKPLSTVSDFTLNVEYEGNIDIPILGSSYYNEDSTLIALGLTEQVYADYGIDISFTGNNLLSSDGGILPEFSNVPVNIVAKGLQVQILSGKIEADGYSVVLKCSKPLAIAVGQSKYFTLKVNSSTADLREFSVLDSTIRFTLQNNLHFDDSVKVSYTQGNIMATDQGALESFSNFSIENLLSEPEWQDVPARIEAEDYSLQSGTDNESTGDTGGGLNVGWIDTGDWLEYAIENTSSNTIREITFRIASPSNNTGFDFYLNNKKVGAVSIPNTGSWQVWQSITKNISIRPGKHYLKLVATNGGFNVNYIDFKGTATNVDDINNSEFNIFPNPVSTEIIIRSPNLQFNRIEIFDITGNVVYNQLSGFYFEIRLPVSLSNGIYMVRISDGKRYLNKKIIVKNN